MLGCLQREARRFGLDPTEGLGVKMPVQTLSQKLLKWRCELTPNPAEKVIHFFVWHSQLVSSARRETLHKNLIAVLTPYRV